MAHHRSQRNNECSTCRDQVSAYQKAYSAFVANRDEHHRQHLRGELDQRLRRLFAHLSDEIHVLASAWLAKRFRREFSGYGALTLAEREMSNNVALGAFGWLAINHLPRLTVHPGLHHQLIALIRDHLNGNNLGGQGTR